MDDNLALQIEDAARAVATLGSISYAEAVESITKTVQSYSQVNFGEVAKGDISLSVDEDGLVRVTQPMTVSPPPSMEVVPAKNRNRGRSKWMKEMRNL